jgi:hypothetical protein
VLLEANAEELTRLQNGGRVPLRLLEISREYARQRRSTMRLPVCTWKIRPATANGWPCALERLPGWSDEVRLEVREGSVDGPLIDSIGSESAGQTQYLVKRGPVYQAYNAHGKRSTASAARGQLFASILHALPDQTRQALGLLRFRVGRTAPGSDRVCGPPSHRTGSASEQAPWPQATLQGAGAGAPAWPGLLRQRSRRRREPAAGDACRTYPALTDQQGGFILKQLAAGRTDAQIYEMLQRRLREWQALESTLAQWEGVLPGADAAIDDRRQPASCAASAELAPCAAGRESGECRTPRSDVRRAVAGADGRFLACATCA